ncbi:MAG TPA: phage capsid protein [Accumulibacter sp.]|uniref:phage capsid protein n=1 Tax=Accumulibacter sp. TaxID=2053492 RepID=UPI0025F3EA1F|nr:phage capsid protein [Accumulibacter sp.]MCM8599916.1 phage capsid protein [Accumulibacter sp.]MCM8664100.1 phage capsid protein [Accumulibacter sp.]HNC51246.1 phage capsid protein [Accumulibacter sp.]
MRNHSFDRRLIVPALLMLTTCALLIANLCGVLHLPWDQIGYLGLAGTTTAFPVNPELSAIAIGWRNRDVDMIADQVLPRVIGPKKFAYTKYTQADGYTVPATRVGRKSDPTMVDFGGTLVYDECVDWGLDDLVPNDEIEAFNAMPHPASLVSPQAKTVSLLTGLVLLDREIRVANLVFNTSNFSAGNQATLSGTSQWSDFTNSNPLDAMLVALDVPLIRPNTVVLGQQVWTKVRQHPRLIQAANASAQTGGAITRQDLADLLEVKNVLVGTGFQNTAKKGQTPTYARVWGKYAALLFVSEDQANADQPTYGFTAQFGQRVAGTIPDQRKGLRGGQIVRVGESVKEVIAANDAGYLFAAAIA